jgi:hypothetical protein
MYQDLTMRRLWAALVELRQRLGLLRVSMGANLVATILLQLGNRITPRGRYEYQCPHPRQDTDVALYLYVISLVD